MTSTAWADIVGRCTENGNAALTCQALGWPVVPWQPDENGRKHPTIPWTATATGR